MSSNKSRLLSLLFILLSSTISQSIIRFPSDRKIHAEEDPFYCDSWRLSVETNNAGSWTTIPSGCVNFVKEYMNGSHYLSDSEVIARESLAFAKSLEISGDGKDAWVFDVDETLLSNVPYYEDHGFGSEIFDEASFDDWVDLAKAPVLPASLNLYKELKNMGFTLFVLTGRSEYQRNATSKNLLFSGYSDWEKLILRGPSDQGVPATVYKSQKRKKLADDGYRIRGNSGDQWSDLLGFAVAERGASEQSVPPRQYLQI